MPRSSWNKVAANNQLSDFAFSQKKRLSLQPMQSMTGWKSSLSGKLDRLILLILTQFKKIWCSYIPSFLSGMLVLPSNGNTHMRWDSLISGAVGILGQTFLGVMVQSDQGSPPWRAGEKIIWSFLDILSNQRNLQARNLFSLIVPSYGFRWDDEGLVIFQSAASKSEKGMLVKKIKF